MNDPRHQDEFPATRRWLVWYPVAAAAVILALVWVSTRGSEEQLPEDPEQGALVYVPPQERPAPEPLEPAPDVERLPTSSRFTQSYGKAKDLTARAGSVAGLFGDRLGGIASSIGGRVERDKLLEHGRTAARFVPFAGPYLRYHRARLLWAEGDEADREAAKRQTVVALVELALDAGSAGLGQAASNSEGLTVALAGAVDVADFMDSALAIHEVLGDPLQLETLLAATRSVDDLAALALSNVEGLDGFVVSLLELESEDVTERIPEWAPELIDQLSDSLGLER